MPENQESPTIAERMRELEKMKDELRELKEAGVKKDSVLQRLVDDLRAKIERLERLIDKEQDAEQPQDAHDDPEDEDPDYASPW